MTNHELLTRTEKALTAMALNHADSKSVARWEKLVKLALALRKQITKDEKENQPADAYEELTL